MKKILVISAINITEGGPLTILQDCVRAAIDQLAADWKIYVLVHDKRLIESHPCLELIEYPLAKKSWMKRLYYEWWKFCELSKLLKPDLWLSLHDITPRVIARRRIVYCHNPSSFYSISIREACLDPKFMLFNLFYKYLYGVGIKRNDYVIVQQNWIRDQFIRLYGLSNVIVAYPRTVFEETKAGVTSDLTMSGESKVFIFPAFPRVFKNFETICEAVLLLKQEGLNGFEVRLTIGGDENRYAAWLASKYSGIPEIKFLGLLSRKQMSQQYAEADCLIFPSRIETWGLPISEAKSYRMSMLVADLPYAHETVGDYEHVAFFKHDSPADLARCMKSLIQEEEVLSAATMPLPSPPFTDGWLALIKKITSE